VGNVISFIKQVKYGKRTYPILNSQKSKNEKKNTILKVRSLCGLLLF